MSSGFGGFARGAGVLVLAGLLAGALMACPSGGEVKTGESKMVVPAPDKSVFMRASFDNDPSPFVGKFLPDALAPHEVDENQGVQTRCSKFIKYEEVDANGSFDEYYTSARSAAASVGVPGIANATVGGGVNATVRVRYKLTKKMRSKIEDQEGLDKCCAEDSSQCPDFIVGEFFRGTGEMFEAAGSQTDFGAGGTYNGVQGDLDFKDSVAWRRSSTFEDTYFAFRKQRVRNAATVAGGNKGPDECGWVYNVPTSLDGKFFVGVSEPAASENAARDLAMRNARTQSVKYLGEYITSAMKTKSSALEGVLEDESVVSAVAEGLTSRVKDQKWCAPEKIETPKGVMYVSKVLAFFPKSEENAAAKEALDNTSKTLESKGKLDKKLKVDLGNAIKDLGK
jgi:hypothetical protein